MKKLNFGRRLAAVATTAALALAVAGCGSSDDDKGADAADGKVLDRTIKVAVFPTFNGLTGYVAQEQGYFEEEGLDVELTQAGAASASMPQLLGGSLDFALMDLMSPILAKSQGVPIVGVAPGANPSAGVEDGEKGPVGLWVRADSKIKTVKELENSTFAIPQIGSMVWLDVRTTVDNAGGDSSKIKFVEAQDQIGALMAGDVEASTSSEPRESSILEEPKLRRLGNYDSGNGRVAYTFVATEKFADANAATVEAFQRAILKANAFISEHKDELPAIAATYIDMPEELLAKAVYPNFHPEPLVEEDISSVIERMVKYEVFSEEEAPEPAAFLWTKD